MFLWLSSAVMYDFKQVSICVSFFFFFLHETRTKLDNTTYENLRMKTGSKLFEKKIRIPVVFSQFHPLQEYFSILTIKIQQRNA